MQFSYQIKGVHCNACLEKIKIALQPITTSMTFTLNPPTVRLEVQSPPSLDELNLRIAAAGDYQLFPLNKSSAILRNDADTDSNQQKLTLKTSYPIILIIVYVAGVSLIANVSHDGFNVKGWMNSFMAGFFLVFSAFKMLNLSGFAEAYANYDLLAAQWKTYGYVYPFIELALGIAYLLPQAPIFINAITIFVMGFSSIGVIKALFQKRKFICACLGTIINVPMSVITLIEDLTMVAMAIIMLFCVFTV